MTDGLQACQTGTLVDRALEVLRRAPADSETVAVSVMGITRAPPVVFERLTTALLGSDPRVRRLPDGRWDLVRNPATSPAIEECTFAVVDVETTGSRAGGRDRITEIGVVLVHRDQVRVTMDTLVNPERAIPASVTRVTRITQELVRDKPVFAEIADELLAVLAGRIFVAHNVRFDWAFVSRELRRVRDVTLDGPRLCTVRLAKRLIPGLKSRGLDSVARYFGVEIESRHRAGGDALATARVLVRLLDRAAERGARTLQDLEVMCGRQARRSRRRRRRGLPQSMEEI